MLFHFLFLALFSAAAGDGVVSSPLTSLPSDAISLLSFKSHSDLDNKLLYNTNEHFDYCQWHGVKCAQGRVVRYSVQSFGLRGTLPDNTLTNLVQLRVLSLKNNSLTGPLPDFSNLINLRTLTLDHNHFTGNFPLTLLPLTKILILDLSFNNFTGVLPENLTALDRLGYLRLDSNKFYGAIPQLNQTMLEVFNVSWNNLSGAVPVTPTMKKFQSFSFLGNPGLCGEVINRPCRGLPFFGVAAPPEEMVGGNGDSQEGLSIVSPPGGGERKHHKKVGVILGFVIGALIVTAGVLSLVAIVRKKKEVEEEDEAEFSNESNANANVNVKAVMRESNVISSVGADTKANAEPHEAAKKVKSPVAKRIVKSGSLIFCSGEEESYSLEQLMRGSAELLGRGTIGTTYKAVMSNQVVVSVKRLDACKTAITSGEAFEQHMEAVGVLRHPNLVPVRAYFQAKQERLIIFDYQHNGSLFNLIHGSRSTRAKPLHWTSCLKIAEDVAQGLAYIHQASNFIHGNLKSSNVLLGSDFEACVTDYCLATLADTSSEDDDPNFSAYKAPEIRNSTRRATAKSDVYAFGVLLLELLTGKPPSQHPFLAPPDMPDWVRAMREDDSEEDTRLRMLVDVASICSLTSPEQRPTMWQVLKMITNVKEIMDDSSRNVHDGYS